MSWKFAATVAVSAIAVGVACLGLFEGLNAADGSDASRAAKTGSEADEVGFAAAESVEAGADAPRLDAQRMSVEIETGGDLPEGPPLPPPGRASFRVVDARTGVTLESVRVRFLDAKRFAEWDGAGEVEATLTPGSWEALVTATAFEPESIPSFTVREGEVTALEPIALARGAGRIEGRVTARHLAPDEPVVVELHGEGRAPCEVCDPRSVECAQVEGSEPEGPCCGFEPERSRLELTGERRFGFTGLAAGVYWIRAFQPAQRIVSARRIEIGRGGGAWTELDVTEPTSAIVELRHARGSPFTGDWESIHRERPAAIVFTVRRDEQDAATVSHGPEREQVLASIGPPLVPLAEAPPADGAGVFAGSFRQRALVTRFISLSLGEWLVSTREELILADGVAVSGNPFGDRIDRDREDSDDLWFDSPPPPLDSVEIGITAHRPDQFELAPLPRELLTLVVSCGHYASEEVTLDLRFGRPPPIVVPLFPTDEWIAQIDLASGADAGSCAACHQEGIPEPEPEVVAFEIDGEAALFTGLGGGRIQAAGLEIVLDISASGSAGDE